MQSDGKLACFTLTWTIPSAEYDAIVGKKLVKYFSPAYKNVVFRFRMELSAKKAEKLRLSLLYEDGPVAKLRNTSLDIHMWKRRFTIYRDERVKPHETQRGKAVTWSLRVNTANYVFGEKSSDCTDAVYCIISIKIRKSSFNYRLDFNTGNAFPFRLSSVYNHLLDAEKSKYSDVQLVSGDGRKFYCHRLVIGQQSNVLATMLSNPKSKKERAGEITFPTLDGDALNEILKYLYTAECSVDTLPTASIMQVAEFGEQYDLKNMKGKCAVVLWQRVAEKPDDAIDILRFADLHEYKYLKDRALDVLVENFERLSLQLDDFSKGNDGDLQGKRLQMDFNQHMWRRVPVVRLANKDIDEDEDEYKIEYDDEDEFEDEDDDEDEIDWSA